MADFINTVDVVGDEALADSIIERTITEFKDDHVLTVGQGAFCRCTALTTVNLPEATKIDGSSFVGCISLASVSIPKAQTMSGYCFQNCTSLTFLDFPVLSSLGYNGFNYCTALETLILRNTEQVCQQTSDAFINSKIAKGEGYIYVPSALLDAYKAATNWSTYANQIRAIEDYPDICGQ